MTATTRFILVGPGHLARIGFVPRAEALTKILQDLIQRRLARPGGLIVRDGWMDRHVCRRRHRVG